MKRSSHWWKLAILLLSGFGSPAWARVSLPAFFSDHMVLQGGAYAPIWGSASPGERIIVSGSWDGASLLTYADSRGRWRVDLATPPPGGPYTLAVEGPENKLFIRDVLVGEVWLASGDANMAMSLQEDTEGEAALADADHPRMRLFIVEGHMALSPRFDLKGRWQVCEPATARAFSALAYHFGLRLHEQLEVPVGLIQATWPEAPIQAWMSRPSLEADPAFAALLDAYDTELRAQRERFDGATTLAPSYPTVLFNAMIAPLAPMALQGVIWSQGTANAEAPYLYRKLFPALIHDWRSQWGWRFSFYFVEQPPFAYAQSGSGAGLREAQYLASQLPNTGMATSLDLGVPGLPYPPAKAIMAHRLARWALNQNYEQAEGPVSGPWPGAPIRRGQRLGIPFAQAPGGLEIRPGTARLLIAGEERAFLPADIALAGDTLWLSHPALAEPLAARYAFEDTVSPALFNQAGLPAPAFRTDDWPRFYAPPRLEATFDRGEQAFVVTATYYHPQSPRLYYRLDGQSPDSSSARFTQPILIPQSARVRVQAYAGGVAAPELARLDLRRHRGMDARLVAFNSPLNGYIPPEARKLLDGILALPQGDLHRWYALKGQDLNVTIDLKEKIALDSVGLQSLFAPLQQRFPPQTVSLALSNNGRGFKEWGTISPPAPSGMRPQIVPFRFDLEGKKARFLRLTIRNAGPVPDSYPGAGGASWLLIDEIWVDSPPP